MSREERPADDLIVAAADNWDHNEATLSGKHSTHAMTSILVTECKDVTSDRIPRVPERSFDISKLPGEANILSQINHFEYFLARYKMYKSISHTFA